MFHNISIKNILVSAVVLGAVFGGGYVLGGQNGTSVEDQTRQSGQAAVRQAAETLHSLDEAAVRQIVEAYIVENPQVILQSVNDYQRNGVTRNIVAQVPPYRDQLENTPGMPSIGNANAEIKIVEFFDYQCPYCKASYATLKRILQEDPTVVLLPKQLPILGGGREDDMSRYAAKAALAAHKQEKFAEFHEGMMESRGTLNKEAILAIASEVGLDIDLLKRDMNSAEVEQELAETFSIAEKAGFLQVGTPSYLIGDQVMVGASAESYERLRTMIEEARRIKTAQN